MRILFCGNGNVGWQIVQMLPTFGDSVAGMVLHPPHRSSYRDEFLAFADDGGIPTWQADTLQQPATIQDLRDLDHDILLSVFFGYIFKADILGIARHGNINLHNGYLPYNRGAYSNVWSIVEETPAGATLHFMDTGIDTGAIIAQRQTPVDFDDTGETLYHKISADCVRLFSETWPAIRTRSIRPQPQQKRKGTAHRVADVQRIDEIDLDQTYTARELINILRARTFPPHEGAYCIVDGQKYSLNISIEKGKR